MVLEREPVHDHRAPRRGIDPVQQTRAATKIAPGERERGGERRRRERPARRELVESERKRREKPRPHLEQQASRVDETCAEEGLKTLCRGLELVERARPHREIETRVEETLRPLRESVLQLERVLEGGTPERVAAAPTLLAHADRRGELRDAPREEGHRGLARTGLDV